MNRRGLFKLLGASAAAAVIPPVPAPAAAEVIKAAPPKAKFVCESCDDCPGGCDYCVDFAL